MPDSLLDRAAAAVEIARTAGAQHAFARANRSRSVSCQVRNGKLEKMQENTSRGLGIELYVDGRYSSHSTNDLASDSLRSFVADAVALTRMLEPDRFRTLPDPSRYGGTRPELDLVDPALGGVSREHRIELCTRLSARIAGQDAVLSASSRVWDGHGDTAAASSNGFQGGYAATSVGMQVEATVKESDGTRHEGGHSMRAHHRTQLMDPDALADEALRRARLRLGTRKGPTLTTTMVVDRLAAGSLIRRLLGPTRGGAIQQKRSMWIGRLGKRAVSRKLTITSDPTLPRGLGSHPFDGEGATSFAMPVLTKGRLQNYFLDTYNAHKLDMPPTTGGWSNLVIEPGRRDLDAIVKGTRKGVYVTQWLGGNADSTSGDFSLGLRGHLIENGSIGAPVGEMNLTGNLLTLFSRVREVGGDPWEFSSIRAPTLVFDRAEFSGS